MTTTLLTASQIFVMDIESYEELMILRQQMLDAGAYNAIVQDLTPERENQLRREMSPERYEDDEEDEPQSFADFLREELIGEYEDMCRITASDLDQMLSELTEEDFD